MNWQRFWWPLATDTELAQGKPLRRILHGVPLVIFRDETDRVGMLQDRCPHRQAPLSAGRVHNGQLECPYHGWRFTTGGHCAEIPGMTMEAGGKPMLKSYNSQTRYGLVWVCPSPDAMTPEPVAPAVKNGIDSFFMTDTVQCTIQQAAENFLDGFHTHFVHAGWIRRDNRRQNVKVNVHPLQDGVEARYSEEKLQSGLISKLLEGDRLSSMGRFRLPGIAEIEYRGRHGLNLLITAWLTPESTDRLRVHTRVATRKGILPGWLKRIFLRRLFAIILRQDKAILEQTIDNIDCFIRSGQDTKQLDSPLDVLGPSIRRLLAGKTLSVEDERELTCRL